MNVGNRIILTALLVTVVGCGKSKPEKPAKAPAKPAAKVQAAANAAAEAAGLSPAPQKDEAPAKSDRAYKLKMVPAGERVDFKEVKLSPAKYVGKTLVCDTLLAPAPMALSPFLDKDNLKQLGAEVDDRRTTCFCRHEGEKVKSTPVTVYFPQGSKGALLHIDRATEFNVEVKGTRGRQVFGLFRGIVKGPHANLLNKKAPDLLSALIWPDDYKDTDVVCNSTLPVVPASVQRFDAKATKLIGEKVAAKKARLRCEDLRGGSVSMDVYFKEADAASVLKIGRGSSVKVILKGFQRNQLVALFAGVTAGAVKTTAGDLKAVLLDSKPFVGKEQVCHIRVTPSVVKVGMLDRKALSLIDEPTAPIRSTMLCGDVGSGVVNVRLFFGKGKRDELLKIGQGTAVRFVVKGSSGNALVGLYAGIKSGELTPGGPKDWRRVNINPEHFVGKKLDCKLALSPYISKMKIIGSQKKAMVAREPNMSERHGVLTCKDARKSIGGTRIEVYFPKKISGLADKLKQGDTVEVKVLGTVYNALITALVRRR